MRIILVKPRGFCAGVHMAVSALDVALQRHGGPVYVYHEIVHNTWVVEYFRRLGPIFVDSLDDVPDGATLLFSAHGVSPGIRRLATDRSMRTIDATCPLVNKVHKEVIRFAAAGYHIVLIGHAGHDEVVGIMSEAPDAITLVETEADIERLSFADDIKLAYLTQTTISALEGAEIIRRLKQRYPDIVSPKSAGICYATQNRQEAVRLLAPEVDVAMVIGSCNSSNSRRLAEIAESTNVCSYLVDGPDDISCGWFSGDETVLVTAGASAPEAIVQECVKVLVDRFAAEVEERIVCQENLKFTLPKELL